MGKTEITWLELINQKLSARKKEGKTASISEVAPEAKAEWVKIKAGTHPDYIQGKAKTHARKNKTAKIKTTKNASSSEAEVNKLLSTLKLCGRCSKQLNKVMKKQKGGNCNLYQLNGPQPLVKEGPIPQSGILDTVEPSAATSTLTDTASAAVPMKGGDCGCELTGGKKSKKTKKSKKSKKSKK